MNGLLVAPHSDDEALFASYVCIAERPLVLVCLRGRRRRGWVANEVRENETRAAMSLLGCEATFLPVPCDPPDWADVERGLRGHDPERVWAPLPELGGAFDHNAVGNLAAGLWPGRVTFYATYTIRPGGRSTVGDRVEVEDGWVDLKRAALACYVSQNSKSDTSFHFEQEPGEYLIDAADAFAGPHGLRLNLGGGINPIDRFDNLDKTNGWRFEDGLGQYGDGTVEGITVSHALMYVPAEHWPHVFDECYRVLVPGGVLRVTEDAIGAPGSVRDRIRPRAAVATNVEVVLAAMRAARFDADPITPMTSQFADRSLIQQNYGEPPDVFHVEGLKPL